MILCNSCQEGEIYDVEATRTLTIWDGPMLDDCKRSYFCEDHLSIFLEDHVTELEHFDYRVSELKRSKAHAEAIN